MRVLIVPFVLACGLGASPSHSATFVGAFGSATVSAENPTAFDPVTFDEIGPAEIERSGRSGVSASASVSRPNTRDGSSDMSVFTLGNPTEFLVEVTLEFTITAQADFFVDESVVVPFTTYDANAFVTLSGPFVFGGSAFASVNGGYGCSVADDSSAGFDCFGDDDNDFREIFDTPTVFLNPGDTLTYALEASAFAIAESDAVQAVPLPAGGLLLLTGLGAALLVSRRKEFRDF